jgi:hypothetical protein
MTTGHTLAAAATACATVLILGLGALASCAGPDGPLGGMLAAGCADPSSSPNARDSAVKARTQAINQLKEVLVGADPALRESLGGLGRATLIRRCAELPDTHPATEPSASVAAAVACTLWLLARRIQLTPRSTTSPNASPT